jgi:hypothetical protein
MASNIKEFSLALRKDAAEWAPGEVRKIHRAAALEAVKGLVRMTPVDTGRARANWQVTQGVPAVGDTEATDKGGAATIAAGSETIGGAQPYSVTYITNNVPYIERLEAGHSQNQAPAGMLNATFSRLKGWLARR